MSRKRLERDAVERGEQVAARSAARTPAEQILGLQRSAGNAAVGRLLRVQDELPKDPKEKFRAALAWWQALTWTPPSEQNVMAALAGAPSTVREALPTDTEPEAVEGEPAETFESDGERPELTAANAPAARERAREGWNALRVYTGTVGKRGARTLPGRGGALKLLEWSGYWLEALDVEHRHGAFLQIELARWAKSDSKETFWTWLTKSSEPVDYVADASERARYMVLFDGGRLWQDGERSPAPGFYEKGSKDLQKSHVTLYESRNGETPFTGATGWSIFVVSAAGVFYAAEPVAGKLHHSSIMAGAAVRAAGEIRVANGKLVGVTPLSGHYRPGNDHLHYAVLQLAMRGVDLSDTKVGHIVPNPHGGGIQLKWFRAIPYLTRYDTAKATDEPRGRPAGEWAK